METWRCLWGAYWCDNQVLSTIVNAHFNKATIVGHHVIEEHNA